MRKDGCDSQRNQSGGRSGFTRKEDRPGRARNPLSPFAISIPETGKTSFAAPGIIGGD